MSWWKRLFPYFWWLVLATIVIDMGSLFVLKAAGQPAWSQASAILWLGIAAKTLWLWWRSKR